MNPLDEHIQTETIERNQEIDYDNLSLNSMSSLGSIPGYETSNNFYEIQRAYLQEQQEQQEPVQHQYHNRRPPPLSIPNTPSPVPSPMIMSGETGTGNIRQRHRFDIPFPSNGLESEDEMDELIQEEPPSPPPPFQPPRLTRNIDIRKWLHGLELFHTLHSHYNAYGKLKYLFLYIVYTYNITLITYFTWNQFLLYWGGIPFLGYLCIEYIQVRVLFNKTPKVSRSHMSYYPGALYDYGCLIHVHHGNFHSNTYEYWVVYDTDTKRTEQVIIRNYNYYNPMNGPHF